MPRCGSWARLTANVRCVQARLVVAGHRCAGRDAPARSLAGAGGWSRPRRARRARVAWPKPVAVSWGLPRAGARPAGPAGGPSSDVLLHLTTACTGPQGARLVWGRRARYSSLEPVKRSVRHCGREGNPRHRRRNATFPSGTGQDREPPRQRRSKTANLQDRRGASQRPSTLQDVADRAPPTPPGHAGPTNALASRPLGARAGAKAGQGRARYPGRGLTNACSRQGKPETLGVGEIL